MGESRNCVNDYRRCQHDLLKNREADALAIASSISDGIYIIDKKGIVTATNKAFMDITGINGSKIIGKKMQEVWNSLIFISDPAFIEIKQKEEKYKLDLLKNKNNLKTR